MLDWNDNKIVIVELPTEVHERAGEHLGRQLLNLLDPHIAPKGATTIASNPPAPAAPGSSLEADKSFRPNRAPPAGVTRENWVTLVIEIAYRQSFPAAEAKALRWLNETSCREVIVIGISALGNSMRACVYRRGAPANPVQGPIQFAAGHCLNAGQAGFQLQISLNSICGGAAHVPAEGAAGGFVNIDLFPLQQAILTALT